MCSIHRLAAIQQTKLIPRSRHVKYKSCNSLINVGKYLARQALIPITVVPALEFACFEQPTTACNISLYRISDPSKQ